MKHKSSTLQYEWNGDGFAWVPEDEIKTATSGVAYLE